MTREPEFWDSINQIRQNGLELTEEEEAFVKDTGAMMVFGTADSLIMFRGVSHEDFPVDQHTGATFYVSREGKVSRERIPGGLKIEAEWQAGAKHPDWAYKLNIPHGSFSLLDVKGDYCKGVTFNLEDVRRRGASGRHYALSPCPFCDSMDFDIELETDYRPEDTFKRVSLRCRKCGNLFYQDVEYTDEEMKEYEKRHKEESV